MTKEKVLIKCIEDLMERTKVAAWEIKIVLNQMDGFNIISEMTFHQLMLDTIGLCSAIKNHLNDSLEGIEQ